MFLKHFQVLLPLINRQFEKRMYIIVDYLQRPLPQVRKLGLSLALSFAKRSVDHRRTLVNLTGLREAIEECVESDDEEMVLIAKEILENIRIKRAGAAFRNHRSSRSSIR